MLIPYWHLKTKYDKLLNYVLAERNPAVYAATATIDPSSFKTFPKKEDTEDKVQRMIRDAYDKAITSGVADNKTIELVGEKRK